MARPLMPLDLLAATPKRAEQPGYLVLPFVGHEVVRTAAEHGYVQLP